MGNLCHSQVDEERRREAEEAAAASSGSDMEAGRPHERDAFVGVSSGEEAFLRRAALSKSRCGLVLVQTQVNPLLLCPLQPLSCVVM